MSEYSNLQDQFPNFSFNDSAENRNKQHHLVCFEVCSINHRNYDINICKKYKGVLTWNSRFYEECLKNKIPVWKIHGFPLCDNYSELKEFIPYDKKINGVTLIARIRNGGNHIGDITNKRTETILGIKGIPKYIYGNKPWGGDMYKGIIGQIDTNETWPSSYAKLKEMNKYKFNLCFENCYHEFWSWDYITEKIFDAFKAKTVPIYYGCYNIEQHIPKELFIDYRDFNNDNELSQYLINFPKDKYIEMIEKAYEFEKTCRLGNIEDFKKILQKI